MLIFHGLGKSIFRLCAVVTVLLVLPSATAWAQQAPIPVFATKVKTDHFVDRLEALGTLRANEAVILSATVTETVSAIHFEDGQRVNAGDVLVEMTSREQHALLREAQSTLNEAQQQFERVQELVKSKLAPRSLLDERHREQETAKARLQAIQSQLQDRLIIAPFAGVVGTRNISIGALVTPGDMITTLDDDSVMKLDFSVPSTYLNSLKEGMGITAKARALDNTEVQGTVSSINFRVDPVTRTVLVRAILPNEKKNLRPGLLMTVELLKNPREVVVIPEEAVVSEGYDSFVMLVNRASENNSAQAVAEKRKVTLGSRRPGEVEVLDGLTPGELLITHGAIRLRPGSPITVAAMDQGQPLEKLLQQQSPPAENPAEPGTASNG